MKSSEFSIWQIAFRPFFLFSSLFAMLAIGLWLLLLTGKTGSFEPYGGWYIWHGHEMVFGYVQAIVIGFLLTASRNWTGQTGASKTLIQIIFAAWLAARVAWLIATIPNWLLATMDMAAPLLAALGLAQTLRAGEKAAGKDNQGHNWPFVGLLLLLAGFQVLFHYLLYYQSAYIPVLQRVAVLAMMAVTFWVSGRVLPFFTRARLQTPPPEIPTILKSVTMTLTWLVLPFYLMQALMQQMKVSELDGLFQYMLSLICLGAAAGHSRLLSLFYRKGVLSEPMLWSLYLAYGWMIAGLISLAIQPWVATPWLHTITIGGLFGMVFSMMARICLGHTGRKIIALRGMATAFAAIQLVVVLRLAASYQLSALLMIACMLVFLFHYLPILCRERADGKPG